MRLLMLRHAATAIVAGLLLLSFAPAGFAEEITQTAGYDPAADPMADIQAAMEEAEASGRHILMEIGGEWCSWCHILERFIHDNPEIAAQIEVDYVVFKVNYSEENKNEDFLESFPAFPGFPHLFVLDTDGGILHSQDTAELESGKGYDKAKFTAFLERWAPDRG